MPSPWAWLAAAFVSFLVLIGCSIYWSKNSTSDGEPSLAVKAAKIGVYMTALSTLVFTVGFWWSYKGRAQAEAAAAAGFPIIEDPNSPEGRLEVAHQKLLKAMASLNTQKATLQERAGEIKRTEAVAANLKAKGVINE